jgi:hypothetical protein
VITLLSELDSYLSALPSSTELRSLDHLEVPRKIQIIGPEGKERKEGMKEGKKER